MFVTSLSCLSENSHDLKPIKDCTRTIEDARSYHTTTIKVVSVWLHNPNEVFKSLTWFQRRKPKVKGESTLASALVSHRRVGISFSQCQMSALYILQIRVLPQLQSNPYSPLDENLIQIQANISQPLDRKLSLSHTLGQTFTGFVKTMPKRVRVCWFNIVTQKVNHMSISY